MTQIRLGVAQPRTWYGTDERRNLDEAVSLIRQAGATGCDLLLFPENFPGPYRERGRFDSIGPLSSAAKENGWTGMRCRWIPAAILPSCLASSAPAGDDVSGYRVAASSFFSASMFFS